MANNTTKLAKARPSTGSECLEAKDLAEPYEPTPQERAAVDVFAARHKETSPTPRVKIVPVDGAVRLEPDHPDPAYGDALLMNALATTDFSFLNGVIEQLFNAGPQADERGLNFMLSVVKGIEPRDHVETMLAAQMAAVHSATMTFARRLAHVDNIPQQDSAERAFNKLARTFAAQVEALKRYRTGGEQKVTVEHVTVNEGGQAIVGNVSHGGRGARKNRESTP